MLRTNNESLAFDESWSELPVRASVPSEDYLEVSGPAPAHPDDRRRFARFRCRGRAILERGSDRLAAYTADISRSGMGIISPVQLLPRESVEVTTSRQKLPLLVVWCLRLGNNSYQCGCLFQQEK